MTRPMRGVGTIVFNEIFVNEKDAYNPRTGEWCLHIPKPKHFCSDLVQSGFVIVINISPILYIPKVLIFFRG